MRGKQSREDSEASARDITWKDIDRERKAEKGQRKEEKKEGGGRGRVEKGVGWVATWILSQVKEA